MGDLFQIDFVGWDECDSPWLCWDAIQNAVCSRRSRASQITANIKHLETDLGLGQSQPGAALRLAAFITDDGLLTGTKVWQPLENIRCSCSMGKTIKRTVGVRFEWGIEKSTLFPKVGKKCQRKCIETYLIKYYSSTEKAVPHKFYLCQLQAAEKRF